MSGSMMSRPAQKQQDLWLASNPSKRWGERFILAYSPVWVIFLLGIVVPLELYERFRELEYFLVGLICALPYFLVPLLIVGEADRQKPWYERYWVKANIWIAIFGYVGNYFWTFYFYTMLGASYTFPSCIWDLNRVPITCYLLTHAYFMLYHTISSMTLRRLRHAISGVSSPGARLLIQAAWVFLLGYLTALAEAITISNFRYYEILDRAAFYKVGSFFYAMCFLVSFPMFIRLDEEESEPWTLERTAVDSLGAAMLVTIVADLWRISMGPIVDVPGSPSYKRCLKHDLPWLC